MYQEGKSYESGTLKPDGSQCKPKSSLGKGTPEPFTVGNWDQFNDWWGSDDDEDTFTKEIHAASSPSPSPSLGVRVVNGSEADEWLELEHEVADPTSYQPGSLAPQLENTSLPDTFSSDPESEPASDSELAEEQREQEICYAQRLLVNRALYPRRRSSLLPYRKTIIHEPVPLMIQAKESQDQAGANQCPQCGSTIFRMISKQYLACTMDEIDSVIEDLEEQEQLKNDEYIQTTQRISDRKCAIGMYMSESFLPLLPSFLDSRSRSLRVCPPNSRRIW